MSSLKIVNLGRKFQERWIFENLNFQAALGDRIRIEGPNGSGKTTFLRCLGNIILPSSGWVDFEGTKSPLIGWAPTTYNSFFPRLTGRENLIWFGQLWGNASIDMKRAIGAWGDCKIYREALDAPFHLCSSGMRQILNLARAFLIRPHLLLLDEPTRSLDKDTVEFIQNELRHFTSHSVVFFSSHSDEDNAIATSHLYFGKEEKCF